MVEQVSGFVALGANLPGAGADLVDALRAAAAILHNEPDVSMTVLSDIWRTPAHPPGSGPDYANAVAGVATTLDAPALLARLHGIEADFGRDRSTGRWAARVLDLDLIDLDGRIAPDVRMLCHWMELPPDRQRVEAPDRLILPHPRLQDRGFVLLPLADIAPEWRHPLTGLNAQEMLARLPAGALDGMNRITG